MTENLYRFAHDMGRMGDFDGAFLAMESDVRKLWEEQRMVSFPLGATDIDLVLEEHMFTLVSEDPSFISEWNKSLGRSVGTNPFDYIF